MMYRQKKQFAYRIFEYVKDQHPAAQRGDYLKKLLDEITSQQVNMSSGLMSALFETWTVEHGISIWSGSSQKR